MKVFEFMFRDENGKQRFKTFPAQDKTRAENEFLEAFPDYPIEAIWDRTSDYITDPMAVFKALRIAGFSREQADLIALLADSIE